MSDKKQYKMKGKIRSFFLDSGAFTLMHQRMKNLSGEGIKEFLETAEFWDYVDLYGRFIRKWDYALDTYANIDIIGDAKTSWRVLKYLERKHKIRPLPVIHYGTDLRWVRRHLKAGYTHIGLGGLATENKKNYGPWLDLVFDLICDTPDNTPIAKVHGFGVSGWESIFRYPWHSVDATSWLQTAGFGSISIPLKRQGVFTLGDRHNLPVKIACSHLQQKQRDHYKQLSRAEQSILFEWLEQIEVPLGKTKKGAGGVQDWKEPPPELESLGILEPGISNSYKYRRMANIRLIEAMFHAYNKRTPYPRPFRKTDTNKLFEL